MMLSTTASSSAASGRVSVGAQGHVIGGQVKNRQAANVGIEHGVQPVKRAGSGARLAGSPAAAAAVRGQSAGPDPEPAPAAPASAPRKSPRRGSSGCACFCKPELVTLTASRISISGQRMINLRSAQGRVPGIALDQRRHGLDGPDVAAGQIGPGDGQITDPGLSSASPKSSRPEPRPLPRLAHREKVMQVEVVVDRLTGQCGKGGSSGATVPVQQRDDLAFQGRIAVEQGQMRADPVRRAQVPFEAAFEGGVAEVGQRRMHSGVMSPTSSDQAVRQAMMIEGAAGQQSPVARSDALRPAHPCHRRSDHPAVGRMSGTGTPSTD